MAKIAIIETGGKQYVATEGTVLTIEKLDGSYKAGDAITFGNVLLTDDGSATKVGAPFIDGATVSAEFVAEGRQKKVTVIRYRQKSRYSKKKGHRQPYMKVKVTALP
jgi:large subunit ribosomal protein L21